jgi:hypothetical protein
MSSENGGISFAIVTFRNQTPFNELLSINDHSPNLTDNGDSCGAIKNILSKSGGKDLHRVPGGLNGSSFARARGVEERHIVGGL